MKNEVVEGGSGELGLEKKNEQILSRRDLLLAASAVGTATLAGWYITNRPAEKVALENLAARPERFDGQKIATECSLESVGVRTLVYPGIGIRTPDFPILAMAVPSERKCQLFKLANVSTEDILVAVNVGEKAPRLNELVQLEGILEKAWLDKKPVYVFHVRTP